MITASKHFQLYAKGKSGARWCTQSTRGIVGRVSHPIAVHLYRGVTHWGVKTLKFVTGTHNHRTRLTLEHKEAIVVELQLKITMSFCSSISCRRVTFCFYRLESGMPAAIDNASCHKVKTTWTSLHNIFLVDTSYPGHLACLICHPLKPFGLGWTCSCITCLSSRMQKI